MRSSFSLFRSSLTVFGLDCTVTATEVGRDARPHWLPQRLVTLVYDTSVPYPVRTECRRASTPQRAAGSGNRSESCIRTCFGFTP